LGEIRKKDTGNGNVYIVAVSPPSSHRFIMKRTQLESSVKQSFNLTLKEFLKQKIEGDGCFDREIADSLHVSISMVHTLRKHYGMERTDSSLRRFENTYGSGAVRRFKDIIENPCSSLADAGRAFGFSRENARRVYHKIYGFPYTEAHRKKMLLRRLKPDELQCPSRRLRHVRAVKDKMISMGLEPTTVVKAKSRLLVTNNNLRVAVLHSSKLRQIGNKKYLYVAVINKQRRDCDFFILSYRHHGASGYFIIPHQFMPKEGTMIAIPPHRSNGKYTRFKDAWHLLVAKKGPSRESS
jgi:hypothetical protein